MTGPKLNEYPVKRPGAKRLPVTADQPRQTKALARYVRVSPYKVREVLDLIRGQEAERAIEILRFCERDAAEVVGKVLGSAIANAEHNDSMLSDELYVSACFADEGPTMKRWRPRARGRATRIRKRSCHVTVIVSRLPEEELARRRARGRQSAGAADRRRRRAGQQAAAERGRFARRRRDAGTPETVEGAEPIDSDVEELAEAEETAGGEAEPNDVAQAAADAMTTAVEATEPATEAEAGIADESAADDSSADEPATDAVGDQPAQGDAAPDPAPSADEEEQE